MTAPRERCSFEAVKAAVQTYYVAKTCCRSPRDTRRKNIPFTIRPDKRLLGIEMTQHQNSSSHALAASKRTQAVEVLGGKRLKPHQQTSRWLKPLATSLAFAFVTLSCPSLFHVRTHFAEHHIRASWLLGLVESPSATPVSYTHLTLPTIYSV